MNKNLPQVKHLIAYPSFAPPGAFNRDKPRQRPPKTWHLHRGMDDKQVVGFCGIAVHRAVVVEFIGDPLQLPEQEKFCRECMIELGYVL